MKIALYSPFMAENIGGGERYLLTVAECLLKQNHQVDLVIQSQPNIDLKKIKAKFIKGFNLELSKLNFIFGPFDSRSTAKDRRVFTKAYDVFYYMSDGSLFIPKAKLNAIHFMIPFNKPLPLIQKLKLRSWQVKTANSAFTKNHIERVWKVKIDHVHLGSVDSKDFKPLEKKQVILNVGRFFSPDGNKHCKKQDFLVKTFIELCNQGLKDWQLILNGPIDKGADNAAYAKEVAKLAKGYPITIRHQGNFKVLQKDYGQAKIYWHATGYGINEKENPQSVEHLGLTTMESMAAGAVPIVINKGGQPEIVIHNINGLLWESQQELMDQTLAIINDKKLQRKLSQNAISRSKDFSKNKFCQTANKIFNI